MRKTFVYSLLAAGLTAFGCMQQAGTNDETTIKSAKVKNPDLTAAANVNVKVFVVNDTTRIPVYRTATDKSGNYSVELSEGMYNIMIGNEQLAAFQDSVSFGSKYSTLKDDTLATTVVLRGSIIMEPNHDPQTVTAQIVGTDRFVTNVASDRSFIIPGLAKGEYVLRCASTVPEYTPTYKKFTVDPSAGDTARVTVTMIYTGIPVVKNLRLSYDTLTGIVKLSWDTLSYFMFKEFVVYRDESGVQGGAPYGSSTTCSFTDYVQADGIDGGTTTYYVAVKTQTLATGQVFKGVETQLWQPPTITLTDTTQWCINKPIHLHAAISGYTGNATLKYAWQFGDSGSFVDGSGPDTVFTPSAEMLNMQVSCKVKVTVNGKLTLETLLAKKCGLYWEKIADCPTNNYNIATIALNDQLLLYDDQENVYKSGDGIVWKQLGKSGLPICNGNYSKPVLFNNRLCTIDTAGYLFTSADGMTWEMGSAPICSTYVVNVFYSGKFAPGVFVYDNKMYVQPPYKAGQDSLLLMSSDLIEWQPSPMKIKASVLNYTEVGGKTYLSGLRFNGFFPDSMWFAIVENGDVRTYNSVGFTANMGTAYPIWLYVNIEVFNNNCLLTESGESMMEVRSLKDLSAIALPVPTYGGYVYRHRILSFKNKLYYFSSIGMFRALW